jgi:hypothetical protein
MLRQTVNNIFISDSFNSKLYLIVFLLIFIGYKPTTNARIVLQDITMIMIQVIASFVDHITLIAFNALIV